jgi:cold shock CspA family protein
MTGARQVSTFGVASSAPFTALKMAGDDDDADAVNKGTVKWFDTTKGFGFIVPDDDGPEVFVHQTEIQMEGFRSLAEGEAVEYRLLPDNQGRRKATYVTGPGGAPVEGQPFRPSNDYDSY